MSVLAIFKVGLAAAILSGIPSGTVDWSYLFRLSGWTGPVQTSWARLAYDDNNREVYAFGFGDGTVRVFNDTGMEIHSFGDDKAFGTIIALAPLENGDIVTLSRLQGRLLITACDFRGVPRSELKLAGVPTEVLQSFEPTTVNAVGRRLYFGDPMRMRMVLTDFEGRYDSHYDLAKLLQFDDEIKRANNDLDGLTVDQRGNILFTIPTQFAAGVVTPAGEVKRFGEKGSAPGRFNIVSGIATDEQGYLYVTDVLRSVVMVFSSSFEFLTEFGYRGGAPYNLSSPTAIVVSQGKVFVSQSAGNGISAFRVRIEQPANPQRAEAPEARETAKNAVFLPLRYAL